MVYEAKNLDEGYYDKIIDFVSIYQNVKLIKCVKLKIFNSRL